MHPLNVANIKTFPPKNTAAAPLVAPVIVLSTFPNTIAFLRCSAGKAHTIPNVTTLQVYTREAVEY